MITLAAPLNFAQPLQPANPASIIAVSQFTTTNDNSSLPSVVIASASATLQAGNITNDVFIPVGSSIPFSLGEAACAALASMDVPADTPVGTFIEQLILQQFEAQFGITGTIS